MPNKEFLEEYPLYRKFKVSNFPSALNNIPKPNINFYCEKCESIQTFKMVNEYWAGFSYANVPSNGQVLNLNYVCLGCKDAYFSYNFLIKIDEKLDYIMKVGQFPPWEIDVDNDIKIILGRHLITYKKGLINESQGYGIGAYAYYRRIVEEIIDELLDGIKELIEENNLMDYEEALERAKGSRNASDKINIVKDMLPPILRPNGMNPLSLLHSNLSEGLHSLDDDECLEKAVDLREILLFLVKQIVTNRESSKKFTDRMKKLLDKK